MSNNLQICEYYDGGMCIYVSDRYGIFETCHFKYVLQMNEDKSEHLKNCLNKKVIERIKKKELEKRV